VSREFREIYGCSFMHDALINFTDDGRHEVSKALASLYRALAPVETGCARAEAYDSGPGVPYVALMQEITRIESSVAELRRISNTTEELVREVASDRARRQG
jgi:hypothetical protein